MNTKHSPRKVTLAMIKGKPITTSVPVIHYHASDDELEEIYPSSEEEKRLTPEFDPTDTKVTSISPKCIEKRSVNESDISENNPDTRSVGTENVLPEGTPPSLDPWKVFSDIKGKITKTFEEKLSEIKSDKKKRRHSKAESSSISDLEDHGCITPSEKNVEGKRVNDETSSAATTTTTTTTMTTIISRHQRGNPVRYVGFSDVKTGLKDKSLQDDSVESGIEASEFAQTVNEDVVSCPEDDRPAAKTSNEDNYASLQHRSCMRLTAFPKRIDLKTSFLHSIQQLFFGTTYKSVAIFIAIFSICYIAPLPEYLLGFIMGTFTTVTFYSILTKLKRLLTTLPEEKFVPSSMIPVLEIPAAEEHSVIERFQGWLNELPYNYEPNDYHVARTKSVFFRLEGNILRIMETRMKIPKKAVWDEPKHKLKFVRRRVYNLTGARIELVPYGLARRRRWSKKYPICITIKKSALICNVTLKNSINDDRSINDYYKGSSKGRMRYRANKKKCVANWREERLDDETRFVDADGDDNGDESMTKQRKKEDEKGVEDDDDDSCYDYDTNNDDVDDEHVEYEECFLNNGGVTEYRVEEDRRTKGKSYKKEQQWEIDRIRRNVRRSYLKDKRKKKIGKKSNVEKRPETKKDDKEQDEKEEEKNEEGEKEDKNEDIEMVIKKKGDVDDEDEEEEEEEDMEEDYEELNLEDEELDDDVDDYYDLDEDDDDYDDEDDDDDDDDVDEDEQQPDENVKDESIGKADEKNSKETDTGDNDNDDIDVEKETGKKDEKESNLKSTLKKLKKKSKQKNELKIFVFARADREKEDWYRRLVSAASRRSKKRDSLSFTMNSSSTNTSLATQRNVIAESKSSGNSHEKSVPDLNYNAYMGKYLDTDSGKLENACSTDTLWFNCLVARILFDIHKCPETINLIQDKIQRKLSSIKLPYFMECLLVSEVTIGQGSPVVRNVTKPIINERGLWLDFDVTYQGSLTMTVETKLNLMKLTRAGSVPSNSNVIISSEKHESMARSAIFDSDLEDTPETSTEDEDASRAQLYNTAKEATGIQQSSGKKFLSMVDRIAANKYFQHATELSYVRRAMEGVSNTEIRLMVTVSSIEGCLSVNVPPAPSDRLWYGFKPVPKVTLTVKPAVGERTVNIVYVTKWIEAKLLREFEKLVVLPNMDDLIMPLCPNYPYTTMR
ncbi:uncharacterized protein LOC100879949 [Megachile rotundata]|uniref:uncharacterized protein LOC100879949 n=1 Tax=Megachile rotundata TaxID=143995 RepID=UPI000614DDCF|nr:PREDICTED: testis-expressed sequence 2 protein-like isoform X1 [Megachile rotundata]XP_012144704.1 PREDICTED: testis-expressed sequence 2 protein-like isoform X2 [Megachile rotundata]